ncbi:PAS domain S-box protein [Ferruginibacter sp.]|nr:PAS domain S-box protein [Ferruginibacter sp.]
MKTELKILMLEDSDADAEMVQRMAKKSDYNCQFKVMMTRDVYEKALVEFKPDIILSDNAMPQFNASEALQILQQYDLHIPFILVTGTVSEEFAASIIKAGADDYLLKDRLTRLPAAIEAALKQKQTEKEKRETVQGLQQSEEKYRRMTERVTDGFVALDNNWNYTYVNKQAGEILKRDPEELVGKNIWTEFPEGVDKPFYKGYHKALDEQRYIHFEEYYPPFDFWLENHIYPSHDGVSVYFRDVTEKKKAEALLKEERDKFAKIASSSPGLICSFKLNTDGMISMPYASAALENILGFKYDLVQYDVSLLFEHTHPEDLEYFKKTIAESAQNLNHWSHEFRYLHPIKGLLWIGGNMLPSREADDCIIWHGIMNDVTERKNNERALDEERDKFAKIATTSPGLIYSMRQNKEGVLSYPYASDAIKEIYGFVFEEIENAPHKIFELIHPDDIELVMKSLYHTKTYLVPLKAEYRYYHPAKGLVWHEVNSLPVEESGGDVVCHGIIMDITERKSAEQKVIKANRLYFFISQINQMIVRTTDEITLFNEVCRIAVELGKFRMAWIGMIDEQTKKIIPVMHAGEESGYLSITKSVFSIDDNPEGHGPTGTAAREGKYIVCNDIENDDRMMPWKEDALARGYHSSMSLPVKKFGKIVGSFSVYASEKFFFDAEEIALLEEATSDLSFALENFEKENQRQKAEAAVIKSEQRYHTLTDVSPVGIFHTDATGDTTYVNPRWCEISGLSFKEGIGYGWLDAVHEDDKRELIKGWENATEVQEFSSSEYRFVRNDGTIAWVLGQATPERNAANEVVGYVGTITDITERKKAEEEIKMVNQRFEIIAAATNDAVFEVDLITGKSSHNKAFIELLDFGIGAVNTDNRSIWRSKLHPDDSERVIKKLEKTYAGTATTWSDEFRFKKADGSYGIFYDRASIIRDDSGKAIRFLGSMVEITDLKKAEEEIKKSNERFELIAKATNDGLWDWNLETNKVWGNEVHQQLYGLTLADPVPSYDEWKKRIHPEDRERTVKALEDAKASGQQSYIDEYRFYAENAGWMNIYGRTLIERNKDGKAIRLIGSMVDITERKKAEELLLANEKRFRKLLENGNDAFAILDISGKPFYVSSSVKRVLGYTEEEVRKMDMFTLVHPDNIEEVQKTMQIVMQNPGVPVTSHLSRLLHKDGTYHWFEDTITNLIDDPDIGGIVDNFRDVTERVKDQLALQDSEEKYRDIVENITDILCTHDLEGNTLSVNATAKKALGYKVEDMLKMKIQDILLPYSKERFADYISTLKKNGFAQGLMYVQTSTGENRIWEFRNTLRTIEGKAPFVYGFAQDVTERIAAEEKLKSKNAQLQTLSDNLPGVMIYQLVGKRDGVKKFTYVSNGVAAITGKPPEEVIENPDILYDVIYKEDIAILIAAEHESLLKMTVLNVEVRCLTHKDEVRWLNIISTPRKLESGQTVWDGFHIDITERKKPKIYFGKVKKPFPKYFISTPLFVQ